MAKRVRYFKVIKKDPVAYTVPQFLAIIKAVPNATISNRTLSTAFITSEQLRSYFADMFTIGFTTGMRIGEIIHLKWDWITPRFIRLPGWDEILDMGITKTRKSRAIPLNSFVREIVSRRERKERKHDFIFHPFSNQQELIIIRNVMRNVFPRISEHAKVPYGRHVGLTFHSTRKSFVTYAADVVPRREVIDKIVGHELKGMRALYEAISDDILIRAMDIYDEWLRNEIMKFESFQIESTQEAIVYKPEDSDILDE
jgi:integrase